MASCGVLRGDARGGVGVWGAGRPVYDDCGLVEYHDDDDDSEHEPLPFDWVRYEDDDDDDDDASCSSLSSNSTLTSSDSSSCYTSSSSSSSCSRSESESEQDSRYSRYGDHGDDDEDDAEYSDMEGFSIDADADDDARARGQKQQRGGASKQSSSCSSISASASSSSSCSSSGSSYAVSLRVDSAEQLDQLSVPATGSGSGSGSGGCALLSLAPRPTEYDDDKYDELELVSPRENLFTCQDEIDAILNGGKQKQPGRDKRPSRHPNQKRDKHKHKDKDKDKDKEGSARKIPPPSQDAPKEEKRSTGRRVASRRRRSREADNDNNVVKAPRRRRSREGKNHTTAVVQAPRRRRSTEMSKPAAVVQDAPRRRRSTEMNKPALITQGSPRRRRSTEMVSENKPALIPQGSPRRRRSTEMVSENKPTLILQGSPRRRRSTEMVSENKPAAQEFSCELHQVPKHRRCRRCQNQRRNSTTNVNKLAQKEPDIKGTKHRRVVAANRAATSVIDVSESSNVIERPVPVPVPVVTPRQPSVVLHEPSVASTAATTALDSKANTAKSFTKSSRQLIRTFSHNSKVKSTRAIQKLLRNTSFGSKTHRMQKATKNKNKNKSKTKDEKEKSGGSTGKKMSMLKSRTASFRRLTSPTKKKDKPLASFYNLSPKRQRVFLYCITVVQAAVRGFLCRKHLRKRIERQRRASMNQVLSRSSSMNGLARSSSLPKLARSPSRMRMPSTLRTSTPSRSSSLPAQKIPPPPVMYKRRSNRQLQSHSRVPRAPQRTRSMPVTPGSGSQVKSIPEEEVDDEEEDPFQPLQRAKSSFKLRAHEDDDDGMVGSDLEEDVDIRSVDDDDDDHHRFVARRGRRRRSPTTVTNNQEWSDDASGKFRSADSIDSMAEFPPAVKKGKSRSRLFSV